MSTVWPFYWPSLHPGLAQTRGASISPPTNYTFLRMLKPADLPVPKPMPLKLAHLLNNDPEADAESETSGQPEIGLMTPILSDRMSPHTHSDDESVNAAIVAAAQGDLRRSTLAAKFPLVLWEDIEKVVEAAKMPKRLTRAEMGLVVHEWLQPNGTNYALLEHECFTRERRVLHSRVAALEDLYGGDLRMLGEAVIAAFETCHEAATYLYLDICDMLPNMAPEAVRRLIASYCPHRPRWLQRETEYVAACVATGESADAIARQLVFRKPQDVAVRVEAARKRHEREKEEAERKHDAAPERKRQSERERDSASYTHKDRDYTDKHKDRERESDPDYTGHGDGYGSPQRRNVGPGRPRRADRWRRNVRTLTPAQLARRAEVVEFVREDLTADGLASTGFTADEVWAAMATMSEVPFTSAETKVIRECVANNTTDSLGDLLPFRSASDITEKRKQVEIAGSRKRRFASDVERLVYEAQWYVSMDTRGRRRRGALDLERTQAEVQQRQVRLRGRARAETKPAKAAAPQVETITVKDEATEDENDEVTEEEKEVSEDEKDSVSEDDREDDEQDSELREQDTEDPSVDLDDVAADETMLEKDDSPQQSPPASKLRRGRGRPKVEKRLRREPRRKLRPRIAHLRLAKTAKPSPRLAALLADAQWFQSVTGDGSAVESGERRKRRAPSEVPEPRARPVDDAPAKSRRRSRRSTPSAPTHVSPYDPPNFLQDTAVPLRGRTLFNDAIKNGSSVPAPIAFSHDVLTMLQPGPVVPINNTVAAKVVRSHLRQYKLLPPLFPPLEVEVGGSTVVNVRNIVHVRYLLYPHHTEQFVLATPKSNELDPVAELQRVFEIHHALYFSKSLAIKHIIHNDYCKPLAAAVDADDFEAFMLVVDQWNTLMLELSPYAIDVDPAIDINGAIRSYLPDSYSFEPSVLDLLLDVFYCEVLTGANVPRGIISYETNLQQDRFRTRYRHLRPINYASAFMELLNCMTDLSRYAVHQLLLRAYTRIVSPDSRKLRCYKAFTAEVYGELLPLFVSEVLTKVGLKPTDRFYDLGLGVGNTTLQAALEFGVADSGGCEIMEHASKLTRLQEEFMQKQLQVLGMRPLPLSFALDQSFVSNAEVRRKCVECNILIVNNYLFDFALNAEVGRLLYGLKPGSKIISLRNFIPPRYKAGVDKTVLDYLEVEKFEMSDYLLVSWTANKVPYYISTVCLSVREEFL